MIQVKQCLNNIPTIHGAMLCPLTVNLLLCQNLVIAGQLVAVVMQILSLFHVL